MELTLLSDRLIYCPSHMQGALWREVLEFFDEMPGQLLNQRQRRPLSPSALKRSSSAQSAHSDNPFRVSTPGEGRVGLIVSATRR